MQYVLIIIGAMLGAASRDGGGLVLGGLIGWLLWRSIKQQQEIAALRRELPAALAPASMAQRAAKPVPAAAVTPELPVSQAAPEPQQGAVPEPISIPAPTAPVQTPPPLPPAKPGLLSTARQWLFGGNTVVKAGIGILFIGLAFLAKYASEHVQLPIEFRLAAIAATALVLLVLGWRLRQKRSAYAQILQGGAIAVLYLTLFTAFRFYGVIGAGQAFALMAVVAALAAALAVLQNAAALAVVGSLGGFATPLLLSSGTGSHVGLFSYYLVLDLGIAAVAWFRNWRLLNLIGFGFTFGVGSVWGLMSYRSEFYPSAQAFLIVFFLVFMAVLLLPARRLGVEDGKPLHISERWVNGSLLFGLPTIAFGLQYGLVNDTQWGLAISALVMAAFYVLLASALRSRPQLALAFEGCLAVGTIFLTLVIPFALDARSTAGAWALEGAGLVWLGWRQQRRLARALGYALVLIAGGLLVHAIDHRPVPTTLINGTLLAGLMLVAGALIAAFVVQRHAARGGAMPGEQMAEPLLIAWALLGATAIAQLHTRALVAPEMRLAVLIGCASAVALVFTLLSARLAWRKLALSLLGFAPLLLLATAFSAVFQAQAFAPFTRGGWWAWPLALAAHLVSLRWAAPLWPQRGQHLAHALGALVLATLGALAGRGLMREGGDAGSAWPWLGWLAVPALMLLALPRGRLLKLWPLRDCPDAYRSSAAAVLSIVMLLWTVLANIDSNGSALPLPYLPLLNPLDLGVALALFAAWRWFQSEPGRAMLVTTPRLAAVLPGVCGFIWLNAMLVRGFHHFADVPFHVEAWASSLAVQTGLTLLWSTTALVLMWWSARREWRTPWMVGAALLGIVVVKLLVVDLSASGTVTRIVSFIGAGVLMLVIGYVAPLPGKEGRHAAS